jgi:hypothetical protein
MRFALSFEGSLPSSGNDDQTKPPSKLKQIWDIRDAISPQIEGLFKTHHALRGATGASRITKNIVNDPIIINGLQFLALIRPALKLKCGLEIQMLVNHDVASIVTKSGDLDNRLKTLFDGLRCPASQQEIKQHKLAGTNPHYCLLEDDALITSLQIETLRNYGAPLASAIDHVRLNITVTVEPAEGDVANSPFRGD